MIEIATAIKTKLEEIKNSFTVPLTKIYADEAPAGTDPEYLVFVVQEEKGQNFDSGSSSLNKCPVLFQFYSTVKANASQAVNLIRTSFHKFEYSFTSGGIAGGFMTSQEVTGDPDKDTQGNRVYVGNILYEFDISR